MDAHDVLVDFDGGRFYFFMIQLWPQEVYFITGLLVISALATSEPGYGGWASIFAATWMKVFTLVTLLAFIYHAWVGIRDIWMDYVKPVGVRLALQIFTILWLVGCGVWAIEILWRV